MSPPPGRTLGGWISGVPGRGGGGGQRGRPRPPALRTFRRRRCWTAPPAAPPPGPVSPPAPTGVTSTRYRIPRRWHPPLRKVPPPEQVSPFPPNRCHSPRSGTASPSRCGPPGTSVPPSSPCPSPPQPDAHRAGSARIAYGRWCLSPPRASAASRRPAERLPRGQPSAGGPRPPGPSAACLGRSHLSGAWCHLSPSSAACYFLVSPAPTGKRVGLSPRGVTPHRTLSRCPCSEGSAGKFWVVPEGLPLSSARPLTPCYVARRAIKLSVVLWTPPPAHEPPLATAEPGVPPASSTIAKIQRLLLCVLRASKPSQHHPKTFPEPQCCHGAKDLPVPDQALGQELSHSSGDIQLNSCLGQNSMEPIASFI